MIASIEKPSNYLTWETGKQNELRFWRDFFATKGGKWQQNYLQRQDSNLPLQNYINQYLRKTIEIGSTAKILDAGAGPLTFVGKKSPICNLDLIAVDALANEYDQILAEFDITPIVRTQYCDVEKLTSRFALNYFDLVHIRNALDHSYDPLLGILQMLDVVKPGGYVLINTKIDEGEDENYLGFHNWNFRCQRGQFIIWDRSQLSVSVGDVINDIGQVEDFNIAADRRWMMVAIRKHDVQTSATASIVTNRFLAYSNTPIESR